MPGRCRPISAIRTKHTVRCAELPPDRFVAPEELRLRGAGCFPMPPEGTTIEGSFSEGGSLSASSVVHPATALRTAFKDAPFPADAHFSEIDLGPRAIVEARIGPPGCCLLAFHPVKQPDRLQRSR